MEEEGSVVRLTLKTCPICKTHVFDDMGTCYNCMYSFGSNPALEQKIVRDATQETTQNTTRKTAHKIAQKTVQEMAQEAGAPLETDSEVENTLEKPVTECGGRALSEKESVVLYSTDRYETPEDLIKEYETMIVCREMEIREKPSMVPAESLFGEFLVEFGGFLRKFLLDRKIGI